MSSNENLKNFLDSINEKLPKNLSFRMVSFFRRLFEMSAPVLMSSSDAAVK